jgi:hypothetical protein
MMVLMLERIEKRLGATLGLSRGVFAGTSFVSMFCVSPPPHLRIVEGVFI